MDDNPLFGTKKVAPAGDDALLGTVKYWFDGLRGGTQAGDLVGTWSGQVWDWNGPSSFTTPDQRHTSQRWSSNDIELVIERVEGGKAYGRIRMFNARGEEQAPEALDSNGNPIASGIVVTPDSGYQTCTWACHRESHQADRDRLLLTGA